MNSNFWQKFKKPIIGLAPMDGVTDYPFRSIVKKYGNPDVMYTEFVSVEGLCHSAIPLLKALLFSDVQRPMIAQVFGKTPANFRLVAVLISELGFDGIDINMGCPAKTVAQNGCGAALIKNPKLAQEIIKQTQLGVKDFADGKRVKDCPEFKLKFLNEIKKLGELKLLPDSEKNNQPIPVSVKTRIGYDRPVVDKWIPTLLEMKPAVISLHGRTLKQQYGGSADWGAIAKASELVKTTETLIFGNGDVIDRAHAEQNAEKYNVDGVLIGRSALGNPFVFNSSSDEKLSKEQTIKIAIEHAELYEQSFQKLDKYSFLPMRKHLAWYMKDFPGARKTRAELVLTNSSEEVKNILM